MSPRFLLSVTLLVAAAPALAQQPTEAAPPSGSATPPTPPLQPSPAEISAIQQAGQAFGTCVSSGVQNVPDSATPEAGAATVSAACGSQRQALVQAVEAMLANAPEPHRTEGRTQMNTQLGQVETQIADAIRQRRAAAAEPQPAAPQPTTPQPN